MARCEFEWIDLAMTSLLANQPVASESERAHDKCHSAAVTPPVNWSFSFLSRVSIDFIAIVSIVISAIAIIRQVDKQTVFRLFTDLITNSNCLQTPTVTLAQRPLDEGRPQSGGKV